jgi:hypothetical protein
MISLGKRDNAFISGISWTGYFGGELGQLRYKPFIEDAEVGPHSFVRDRLTWEGLTVVKEA